MAPVVTGVEATEAGAVTEEREKLAAALAVEEFRNENAVTTVAVKAVVGAVRWRALARVFST